MTNCRCQGIACETEDREHVEARDPAWLRSNAPSNTSATRRRRLPNFARNLSWSFFETPQKHCNSNDANSMIEQAAGELRAKLMGGGGAWPGFEATRRAKLAARTARGRAAAHRHTQRPGPPAPGTPAGPQPQTRQSGPEPLGSGPPSILSDYRRHATGGATRQVALRDRWCHAAGDRQCTTTASCQ